jgi:hypothetical protein
LLGQRDLEGEKVDISGMAFDIDSLSALVMMCHYNSRMKAFANEYQKPSKR